MKIILHNALLIDSAGPVDIAIDGTRIAAVEPAGTLAGGNTDGLQLDLAGSLLFPGLINSHDHLDFNLFPQLGNATYRNYTQWGRQLQTNHRAEIDEVLRVPLLLREQWGVMKNLLAGVTTVVNHGLPVKIKNPAISIHERYHFLHSVAFEKNWRRKLNNPFRKKDPVVIHVGEGTDRAAHREIDRLLRWNWLGRRLVGVHAVAMDRRQASSFEAIVWCPGSNFFMLNETAPIDRLKESARILFGTDSTLTASWNIWEHIRLARNTGLLSDEELYRALTENPAHTWKTGTGKIAPGAPASLVVSRFPAGLNRMDAFFGNDPESIRLVVHEGAIKLFDESLLAAIGGRGLSGFSRFKMAGLARYVSADLPAIVEKIQACRPESAFPITLE